MAGRKPISGYGLGSVDTVMSVDAVEQATRELEGSGPSRADLLALTGGREIAFDLAGLKAGYGRMEILHGIDMLVGRGQSLCLIGPNGAGKSTVLHAIFGFSDVMGGSITADGKDITRLTSNEKLSAAGVAYILQDNSVFPDMTVEENLLMGGFLKNRPAEARRAADRVFEKYARLAERRKQKAGTLSGGERRLLEISRALIMDPRVLLVDEPSIGLEPRFIDMVFEILGDLQRIDGKTIVMVEQNARKGLEFADIGYVLVSGQLAKAGPGEELLADEDVGRLFLGGQAMLRANVCDDHQTSYEDPIRFARGDRVELTGRKDIWDGHLWLWAVAPDGREGWIPDNSIETNGSLTCAVRAYDAIELTCARGERLDVLEETHGWAWSRNGEGRCGWVPRQKIAVDDEQAFHPVGR